MDLEKFWICNFNYRLVVVTQIMLRRGIVEVIRVKRHFPIHYYGGLQFIRSKSKSLWLNPLSKFLRSTEPQVSSNSPSLIIEEPQVDVNLSSSRKLDNFNGKDKTQNRNKVLVQELKHYLKSTDIPQSLQIKVLKEKLSEYIQIVPDYSSDQQAIPLINKVFLKLYRHNPTEVLTFSELLALFEKSAIAVTNNATTLNTVYIPEYVAILVKMLLQTPPDVQIPMKIYAFVVELGSHISKQVNFGNSLQLLLSNETLRLSPDFTIALIKYLEFRKKLNLTTFEEILCTAVTSGRLNEIINDEFVDAFIGHIERLYQDQPPKVHEYVNLERNIDNVQRITDYVSETLLNTDISVGSKLKLFRVSCELDSVNSAVHRDPIRILVDLQSSSANKELLWESIRRCIFQQDLGDEALALHLLVMATAGESSTKELASMLSEYIVSDDIKFSFELRLQARISQILSKQQSESESFELVKVILLDSLPSVGDLEPIAIHAKVVQIAVASLFIAARGYFVQSLTNLFQTEFQMAEPSVYSYQHQVNKAIQRGNHIQAINAFEDSLENFSQWPTESDPMIRLTLSSLLVLLCEKMDSVEDIFPIFTKVKQQMTNSQCNIHAINAMSTKMLQAEFVGDAIEFLKRELPKIGKEDNTKLPLTIEAYYKLFSNLQSFVLTYSNESTFETNWVLYGEVHKYFHVPNEFYLPAMKFFSSHDRQNASLIIFRHMLRLSELHGDHHHLPPLREHYLFLFQEFGNKLYEEGVEEIHERLKMNLTIPKQDIELQNCILNAYLNLQDISKAKDLFLSMLSTPKQIGGINEETIQIMIKTYTYSDIVYVQKFWNNLSQYGIVPNYPIMKQYLIAHVYHGQVEDAIELVNGEMKDYEIDMSPDLLTSMFNYCLEAPKQKRIADWAENEYPQQWEEAKSSGLLKAAEKFKQDFQLISEGNSKK